MTGSAPDRTLTERAARELLGAPNRIDGDKLRFGDVEINLSTGKFYDFDLESGGDILDLIRRERGLINGGAEAWLAALPPHADNPDEDEPAPVRVVPPREQPQPKPGTDTAFRAPPHNVEAEQALIGAILLKNDAYGMVASSLRPEQLYEPFHREIFRAAGSLIASGKPANPVTLKDMFPDFKIAGFTSREYIARLVAEAVTVVNVSDYADVVRDLSGARDIIAVAEDLHAAADRLMAPDAALREAWDRLDRLRGMLAGETTERGMISGMINDLLEDDDSLAISTGLKDVDTFMAGGYRTGRLVVIGGRPSMGKTVLLCSSARRVAIKGVGVSIFSLETDKRELTARMVSDELARTHWPIPYRDIVAGKLSAGDLERVREGAGRVGALPIHVDTSAGLTIAEIEARVRIDRERMARNGIRLGVVMIDYLGLIRFTDRYRGRKVDELGEVTQGAKAMAKRLEVAVVMMAQLNRGVESRDDKRPGMADLRESGNIEQDADAVALLYRPVYYIERSAEFRRSEAEAIQQFDREKHHLEFILGKNRLGPAATIDLWCDPAQSAVDNWRAM